jgi:RNA polymerase sigma-70 factor (ECF subfamily)
MTGSLDAAEEVLQDVAVIIMDSGKAEEIRDFRAWAKEIVRRQALNYFRKNRGRVRAVDPELLEQISIAFVEDASDSARIMTEMNALRGCLDQLPEKSRALFDLRFEKHSSFDDIARVLGGTGGAVQRAISRMRRSLRDCMDDRLKTAGES